MTQHRFIRCPPSAVLDTAYPEHNLRDGVAFDAIQHWRRPAESERGWAVHWFDHVPVVGEVGCCLSVEGGANGALAHLTATHLTGTAAPQRGVLPKPLVRLALSSWSHRKLVELAKIAEARSVELRDVGEA